MDIYIAVCEDRFQGTLIRAFDNEDKAVDYAKKFVVDNAYSPGDIEKETVEGWIYFCKYAGDDDYVYVVKTRLNGAI